VGVTPDGAGHDHRIQPAGRVPVGVTLDGAGHDHRIQPASWPAAFRRA